MLTGRISCEIKLYKSFFLGGRRRTGESDHLADWQVEIYGHMLPERCMRFLQTFRMLGTIPGWETCTDNEYAIAKHLHRLYTFHFIDEFIYSFRESALADDSMPAALPPLPSAVFSRLKPILATENHITATLAVTSSSIQASSIGTSSSSAARHSQPEQL